MYKRIKPLLCLLLSTVMVFSGVPVYAQPTEETQVEQVLEENTVAEEVSETDTEENAVEEVSETDTEENAVEEVPETGTEENAAEEVSETDTEENAVEEVPETDTEENAVQLVSETDAEEVVTEETLFGRVDVVDKSRTNGAPVYVYVPGGVEYVYSTDVVPIVLVYCSEAITTDYVQMMVKESGLQAYARRESAVVTFVNPVDIEKGWDAEADVEAYKYIVDGIFTERPDVLTDGMYTNNRTGLSYYAGAKTRVSVIAEGEAADFVSQYLVTDDFYGYFNLNKQNLWARGPACVMLFNPRMAPFAEEDQFPAIIINGTDEVVDKFDALNAVDRNDIVTLESSVEDGFDYEIIKAYINKLISYGRVQVSGTSSAKDDNQMIFDMPVFSEIGVEVIEGTYTCSVDNTTKTYEVYMPEYLKDAEDGTVPLLLNFPGMGLSSNYQIVFSGWGAYAAEAGFVTVGVNQFSGSSEGFAELIDYLLETYPQLDASRVYASGFSMGSILCGQLATEIPEKLAGVVATAVLRAPSGELIENIKIPVYYVGGHLDGSRRGHSVFPTDSSVEGNCTESNEFWEYIFAMNDIDDGTYVYDAAAENTWWGVAEFDDVEIQYASQGTGVYRINSLESNDGVVYTKMVDVSHWGHEYFPELCQDMWGFLSQFSRNEDGSIEVAEEPAVGEKGRIEIREVNDTDVYVYVPHDLTELDRWTAPIIMVYGDEPYTAQGALETAETYFAEIASDEHACIAFMNPKGETWDAEADRETYLTVVEANQGYDGLYMERPDSTWKNGVTADGKYGGYQHRIYVIAEGSGADFASSVLADDTLMNPVAWASPNGSQRIPASFMLFNVEALPSENATIAREYPAVIVNGTERVGEAYKALNKTESHVAIVSSDITDGFDKGVLTEWYYGLANTVRRQQLDNYYTDTDECNVVIYDIADYDELGIKAVTETQTLESGKSVSYIIYLPEFVDGAEDGSIPLVMGFHGAGEKAEYFAMLSGWPELGAEEGFITVMVDQHLSYTAAEMEELLDLILADYPEIDASRVYATGFSMGSTKTLQLAISYPERFAAVAALDGYFSSVASEMVDTVIPTYYLGGWEDNYNVLPSVSSRIGSMLDRIFTMNGVEGGYTYDEEIGSWWGMEFDETVVIEHTNGIGVLNEHSVVSADGMVYTKVADVENLSHNVALENTPYLWAFMKNFKRNMDGSITYGLADMDKLSVLYDLFSKLDADDYTSTTWNVMEEALNNAKKLIDNPADATQEMVDFAQQALIDAMELLIEKGNKAVLENLIANISGLDKEAYTEESWNALEEVLKKAKEVYVDKDATEEEVSEVCNMLIDALFDLDKAVKSDDEQTPVQDDKNTSGGNTSGGNTSGGNTSGGNTSGGNTSDTNTPIRTVNTGDESALYADMIIVLMSAFVVLILLNKRRITARRK